MTKRGKKYREAIKLVDRNHLYDAVEAMELVKTATANFDKL